MPGYFLATYNVTDPDMYKAYVAKASELTIKHSGKPIILTSKLEVLEGAPLSRMVVVEFPDYETAQAWYNDPEYQAIVHLRHDSTEGGWAMLAPEFQMP